MKVLEYPLVLRLSRVFCRINNETYRTSAGVTSHEWQVLSARYKLTHPYKVNLSDLWCSYIVKTKQNKLIKTNESKGKKASQAKIAFSGEEWVRMILTENYYLWQPRWEVTYLWNLHAFLTTDLWNVLFLFFCFIGRSRIDIGRSLKNLKVSQSRGYLSFLESEDWNLKALVFGVGVSWHLENNVIYIASWGDVYLGCWMK